jgi:hypothetical protein
MKHPFPVSSSEKLAHNVHELEGFIFCFVRLVLLVVLVQIAISQIKAFCQFLNPCRSPARPRT